MTSAPADAPGAVDIVIDTNVWLDAIVFADAALTDITAALIAGRLRAHIDDYGRTEFARVIARLDGKWRLDASAQAAAMRLLEALSQPWRPDGVANISPSAPPLPRCRDRDDQPFLLLACRCRATWLLSRDRDLLRLARRVIDFRIVTPAAASKLLGDANAG